jgi:heterotetrameric sarcosine oxidase delta subunit
MLQIDCPHCGVRDAAEFRYTDEVRPRPHPGAVRIEEWRAYLYRRDNPAGWTRELWLHRAGCDQYLVVERHTVTNEVRRVVAVREQAP